MMPDFESPAFGVRHLPGEELVDLTIRAATPAERNHLEHCSLCRTELEAYRATLASLAAWQIPERPAGYGRAVWDRLAPRMPARRSGLRFWPWPALAAASAVAAVLLAAVFLSRPKPVQPAVETSVAAPAPAAQRLLNAALQEHAERTRTLLSEIEQRKPDRAGGRMMNPEQRSDLADLIAENRIYRQTAEQENNNRAALLLSETESVLVDLEHASRHASARDMKAVQERIAETKLASRLNLVARSPEPDDGENDARRGKLL
jgi:hypothetical protein